MTAIKSIDDFVKHLLRIAEDYAHLSADIGEFCDALEGGETGPPDPPIDPPADPHNLKSITIKASKTGGVAPHGVHFEADVSGVVGIEQPLRDLAFEWDISGTLHKGPVVAHLFRDAGTFTARLTVKASDGGVFTLEISIYVSDPAAFYPADATILYDPEGQFVGAELIDGVTTTTWGDFVSRIDPSIPQRLSLAPGASIDIDPATWAPIARFGPDTTFGSWGDEPFTFRFVGDPLKAANAIKIADATPGLRLVGLRMEGAFDPSRPMLAAGIFSTGVVIKLNPADAETDVVFLGCSGSGVERPIAIEGVSGGGRAIDAIFVDCDFRNWSDYGMACFGPVRRFACLNTKSIQHAHAYNGTTGKLINDIPSQGLPIFQIESVRDDNGVYVFTVAGDVPPVGTDIVISEGPAAWLGTYGRVIRADPHRREIAVNPTQTEGQTQHPTSTMPAPFAGSFDGAGHQALQAQHGPLRISQADRIYIDAADFVSTADWSGKSATIVQPAVRLLTGGGVATTEGEKPILNVQGGTFQGGLNCFTVHPDNRNRPVQAIRHAIIDGVMIIGDTTTEAPIACGYGDATFRNITYENPQPSDRPDKRNKIMQLAYFDPNAGVAAEPANFVGPLTFGPIEINDPFLKDGWRMVDRSANFAETEVREV